MQTKRLQALVIGALFLLAGAAVAFAHGPGSGYHDSGMMGSGQGMGPGMMGQGRNDGNWPDLTKEQQEKLDAAREKFWTENRKLRREIEDKQDELYDELAKPTADEAKVMALQKELSKLEGDFDQKVIQHKLEVHKIAPELHRGRGYHRGYGGGNCRQQQY